MATVNDTINFNNTNIRSVGAIEVPKEGTLATEVSTTPVIIAHEDFTIVDTRAYVKTVPTLADIIIDINVNGSSIFGATKLEIAASANAGQQSTISSPSVTEGDIITIDIDQIGSGDAGEDLTVMIKTKTGLQP